MWIFLAGQFSVQCHSAEHCSILLNKKQEGKLDHGGGAAQSRLLVMFFNILKRQRPKLQPGRLLAVFVC